MRIIEFPLAPRQSSGKTAKIDELKAEIANITRMIKNGMISKEEGQARIQALLAEINKLENNTEAEIEPPQETTIPSENQQSGENKSENPTPEYGQGDYFAQQAIYNKAILGLN